MKKWINENVVLIVGLGLMGGSYARGLKKLGYRVNAIDSNPDSIEYALSQGWIDAGTDAPTKEFIGQADAVIFALYPKKLMEWIEQYQDAFQPGIYISDVTGIKGSIVYDIQKNLRKDVEYIPAHPIAGREKSGVQYADPSVFHDANYIITPTEQNTKEAVRWCEQLARLLGFRTVTVMSPEEHDEMIGYVSQLTHCIAVSLMTCKDIEHLCDYTGDSFRDLTRIANINDEMWSELFLMNKEALLCQMEGFIREITDLKEMIANEEKEEIRKKMRLSTKRREAFDR